MTKYIYHTLNDYLHFNTKVALAILFLIVLCFMFERIKKRLLTLYYKDRAFFISQRISFLFTLKCVILINTLFFLCLTDTSIADYLTLETLIQVSCEFFTLLWTHLLIFMLWPLRNIEPDLLIQPILPINSVRIGDNPSLPREFTESARAGREFTEATRPVTQPATRSILTQLAQPVRPVSQLPPAQEIIPSPGNRQIIQARTQYTQPVLPVSQLPQPEAQLPQTVSQIPQSGAQLSQTNLPERLPLIPLYSLSKQEQIYDYIASKSDLSKDFIKTNFDWSNENSYTVALLFNLFDHKDRYALYSGTYKKAIPENKLNFCFANNANTNMPNRYDVNLFKKCKQKLTEEKALEYINTREGLQAVFMYSKLHKDLYLLVSSKTLLRCNKIVYVKIDAIFTTYDPMVIGHKDKKLWLKDKNGGFKPTGIISESNPVVPRSDQIALGGRNDLLLIKKGVNSQAEVAVATRELLERSFKLAKIPAQGERQMLKRSRFGED